MTKRSASLSTEHSTPSSTRGYDLSAISRPTLHLPPGYDAEDMAIKAMIRSTVTWLMSIMTMEELERVGLLCVEIEEARDE